MTIAELRAMEAIVHIASTLRDIQDTLEKISECLSNNNKDNNAEENGGESNAD